MTTGRIIYFVDFANGIDWKPTELIDQELHPCIMCNVLTKEMYLDHRSEDKPPKALCTTCYACAETSHTLADFCREDHRLEDILHVRIRCWNSGSGCHFTGTLSDVSSHFYGQCKFHKTMCPKCNDYIFHRDMFHHVNRKCQGGQVDTEKGSRFESMLSKLMETQAALHDTLDDLSAKTNDGLRHLEHSVSGQIRELGLVRVKQDEYALSSSAALNDIQVALEQFPGLVRHQQWLKKTSTSVLQLTGERFLWSVENVSYHVDTAIHTDSVRINSDCFTFAGYKVRFRVTVGKRLTELAVAIHLCLCPSARDDALEWPFKTPFTLSLVHPKNRSKSSVKSVRPEESQFPECFERPLITENSGVGGSCFTTGRMLAGFVVDDAILVSLERIDTAVTARPSSVDMSFDSGH